MDFVTPILWIGDQLRGVNQRRRKVLVQTHTACHLSSNGQPGSPPEYSIKIANLSPDREIEITHIWFETGPPFHLLNDQRPLPARLKLDQTYETWVPVFGLPTTEHPERAVRVRLSSGKVVKGRLNKHVPLVGYIAGGGDR